VKNILVQNQEIYAFHIERVMKINNQFNDNISNEFKKLIISLNELYDQQKGTNENLIYKIEDQYKLIVTICKDFDSLTQQSTFKLKEGNKNLEINITENIRKLDEINKKYLELIESNLNNNFEKIEKMNQDTVSMIQQSSTLVIEEIKKPLSIH
jgi:hypothetical protein